jgi:hypothetical protein
MQGCGDRERLGECDEAARRGPHGFGQHENSICARPRREAREASNFVSAVSDSLGLRLP